MALVVAETKTQGVGGGQRVNPFKKSFGQPLSNSSKLSGKSGRESDALIPPGFLWTSTVHSIHPLFLLTD